MGFTNFQVVSASPNIHDLQVASAKLVNFALSRLLRTVCTYREVEIQGYFTTMTVTTLLVRSLTLVNYNYPMKVYACLVYVCRLHFHVKLNLLQKRKLQRKIEMIWLLRL